MKRTIAAICIALVIGALVIVHPGAWAGAELTTPLTLTLTGAEEVPPVDNGYSGTATMRLTTASLVTAMCVEVILDLSPGDGFSGMHVNRGAVGIDGPVEIPLNPVQDQPNSACSSNLYGSSVLAEMVAEPAGFYLEVDTQQSPDGAARGQLVPAAVTPSSTSSTVASTTTSGAAPAAPAVSAAAAFTG